MTIPVRVSRSGSTVPPSSSWDEGAAPTVDGALADYAVAERAIEELEALPAVLPAIQAEEQDEEEARKQRVLREAAPCPAGHPMSLRRGKRGMFWGCTEYPTCRETRELSADERARLAGR